MGKKHTCIGKRSYIGTGYTIIKLKNGNLCSGSADFYVKIWDWKNGVCLSSIKAHENWVKCLCQFDDDILLSGSDDRTINLQKYKKN